MTKLTKEQLSMLEKEAKKVVGMVSEGKNTQEILSEIYVQNLEDKSKEQGDIMAEATIKAISEFDEAMEQALEDKEAFVDSFMAKMDEGKTPAERCTYWLRFTSALLAVSCEDEAEKAEHLKNADALTVTDEKATPELEQELKANAKEALLNNTTLLNNLENFSDCVDQIAELDDTASVLTGLSKEKVDLRAVMSMLFYVKVMNGEIQDAPEDVTIDQIATAVCAGAEEVEVLEKLSAGKIAKDVAVFILGTISTVFASIMLYKFGLLFVEGAAAIFYGTFLYVPIFIGLGIALLWFIFKNSDDIYEIGYGFAKVAVKVLSEAIKFIGKAVRKAVEISVKAISFVGKKMINLVKRLFNHGDVQQTTPVTV